MSQTGELAGGLYVIENTVTGAFYVGSSKNLANRERQHFGDLRRGAHRNAWLQRSFAEHGESAFRWAALCLLPVSDIVPAEQRLLDRLVGHPMCYNASRDAQAVMTGRQHSPEAKAKMRAAKVGRKQSPEHVAKVAAHGSIKKAGSPEARRKAWETRRRNGLTEKDIAWRSAAMKRYYAEGRQSAKQLAHKPPSRAGTVHSEETRAKMRSAKLRRREAGQCVLL